MTKLPFIHKGHHGGMDFQADQKIGSSIFLYAFFLGVFVFFIILILRLSHLTIVKGEYYRRLADSNRIRETIIEPKRGILTDRKGVIIAQNSDADIHSSGQRLMSKRSYQNAEVMAPIVGYRQVADSQDIKNDQCLSKIISGDKVGKKGVEKIYECDLRGTDGKKLTEVDASGKSLRTLGVVPPRDGKTIQLAVDSELQKKAYEIINSEKSEVKGKKVVIVGLKPQTGEVILLVSSPSYNPQDFEDNNTEAVSKYFTDTNKPLFNRATEGTYPPGSIFKIILAAGVLEDKKIDENTTVEDTGILKAGPLEFGNWYYLQYGKTEGEVNIVKALQRSNDIFFYKIGEKMGNDSIKSWAEKFGYGRKTGIGLEEADGLIPSSFWKEEVLKEQWYLGDTYNFSIGQGYSLVTPIQVAQATSVIANNGYLCKPKLLKVGSDGGECQKLNLSQKTLDLVKEGMTKACVTGGTGWPLFEFRVRSSEFGEEKMPVACKTGTAESHGALTNPHAWFTVFAPIKDPQIVLTVLVEEGGQGSDVAGPIARDILKAYFERKE